MPTMSTPGPIQRGLSPPLSAPSAQSWGTFLVLVVLAAGTISCGGTDGSINAEQFSGTWSIDEERSTDISPWNGLTVQIDASSSQLTLERIWGGNYGVTVNDSMTIPIDGEQQRVPMQQWPDNRHIGASLASDSSKTVSAEWLDNGRTLRVTTRLDVRISQGTTRIRTYSEYRISPNGGTLTVLELRSTRPRPLHYTFVPAESS